MERSTFEHFLNPKGTYLNTTKKEEEEGVWVVLCLRARQRDAAMADGSQGRFRNAGQGSRQQRPSQQVAACLCELSAAGLPRAV